MIYARSDEGLGFAPLQCSVAHGERHNSTKYLCLERREHRVNVSRLQELTPRIVEPLTAGLACCDRIRRSSRCDRQHIHALQTFAIGRRSSEAGNGLKLYVRTGEYSYLKHVTTILPTTRSDSTSMGAKKENSLQPPPNSYVATHGDRRAE